MTTAHFLTTAWQWNPRVIAASITTLVLYGIWQRGRFSGRAGWLLAGVLLFYLTLASPIDTLADGYLFSAHMLQHLLLLLLVPALMLLGLPATPVAGSQSVSQRPGAKGRPRRALAGWWLGMGGMWLWHAPALCDAAVANVWVHRLQYVSLLGLGFAFWRPIVGPRRGQRLPPLAGIIYLFSACLGCTVLGIIITFAPVEICSIYRHPVDRLGILPLLQNQWGLTPAYDQQLGGLLMWVPACLVYFTGILALFARWHREADPPAPVRDSPLTTAPGEKTHAW